MMSEQVEVNKETAKVVVNKVANGYMVTRAREGGKHSDGFFGGFETEDFVFVNLADVVKFLGDHYKEPTVGVGL